MTREPLFRCTDVAMLRAPVHPVARASWRGTAADGRDDGVGALAELLADPLVGEALAISSPSLAHRLDALLAPGTAVHRPADVRRALRALTSYRLRMATRCTPFGLMAGVAKIEFVDDPADAKVRLGTGHRRHVRPDLEWLNGVVRAYELRPEGLRVVLNNLCFVRGDRFVLPYVPNSAESRRTRTAVQEVSVRHTSAIRAVAGLTDTPIHYRDLADRLAGTFPTVPGTTIDGMLRQLIGKEFLLTEVRPGMDTLDPLDHVTRVVNTATPGTVAYELVALRQDLDRYAARPLGAGRPALAAVRERMRGLAPGERLVQVDLALDADVALPRAVAAEAERAATLLWRLAPREPGTATLRQYHNDFLERYGRDRLVPLRELLDPDIGLGAPAGYLMPPTPRVRRPEDTRDIDRDRALAELAQEAMLSGRTEIELTDDHALLTRFTSDEGRPPASLDLHTHLIAPSVQALREGDFRLVVIGGLGPAAASFGRFAHLLDDATRDECGAVARTGATRVPGARPVQLTYQVRTPRGANVSQVPRWAPDLLPVAAFAETGDPSVCRLGDLAVGGDVHGMYVIDTSTGGEIAPTAFHLLNAENEAPNTVRFLREVGAVGVRRWTPWSWGGLAALPYTPRVRYGRSVLAPARWRPTDRLCDQEAPFAEWAAGLAAWRERWRVPGGVCLCYADQRIELDLGAAAHQRLLRDELRRRSDHITLTELPSDTGAGTGWLTGPDGAHRNEVVFPLVTAAPATPAQRTTPGRPTGRGRPAAAGHPPGGAWLYASVYCTSERQDELLPAVTALTAGLDVDRWFFLRYGDPDHHLRLRFHGSPAVVTGEVLPRLTAWTTTLRESGMARKLVLDTYDPEVERYGGPAAIEAAERAFHADSVAVIEQLRLLASGRLDVDPVLLAAANYVDLAARFWSDAEQGADWVVSTFAGTTEHRAFQRCRRTALELIGPHDNWAGLRAVPGGEAVLDSWAARAEAVTHYGRLLREAPGEREARPGPPPAAILASLTHMHHNRLVGLDREAELRSRAVARGAIAAHRARRRAER